MLYIHMLSAHRQRIDHRKLCACVVIETTNFSFSSRLVLIWSAVKQWSHLIKYNCVQTKGARNPIEFPMQLYEVPIQFLLLNAIKIVSFENLHSKFQTNWIIDFLISFRCLSRCTRWMKSVCSTFVPMNHTRRNLCATHLVCQTTLFPSIGNKRMLLTLKNTDGANEDEMKKKISEDCRTVKRIVDSIYFEQYTRVIKPHLNVDWFGITSSWNSLIRILMKCPKPYNLFSIIPLFLSLGLPNDDETQKIFRFFSSELTFCCMQHVPIKSWWFILNSHWLSFSLSKHCIKYRLMADRKFPTQKSSSECFVFRHRKWNVVELSTVEILKPFYPFSLVTKYSI